MADKEHDNPANKRLGTRFKKAIQSGEDGKTIPRIYREEVARRMVTREALYYMAMGPLLAINVGLLVGTLQYATSDQTKPVDAIYGVSSAEGLQNGQASYQALRVNGRNLLVINAPVGGEDRYSVYTFDEDGEFHYVQSESAALGHLHEIQTALRQQITAMERGERTGTRSAVDFLTVNGLSDLHLEEGDVFERQYRGMSVSEDANRSYAAHLTNTSTHVQTALTDILNGTGYGEGATIAAGLRDYESGGDYESHAAMNGLKAYLALLLATPLLLAGNATRRRVREAKTDHKKPS